MNDITAKLKLVSTSVNEIRAARYAGLELVSDENGRGYWEGDDAQHYLFERTLHSLRTLGVYPSRNALRRIVVSTTRRRTSIQTTYHFEV
jgi:hypothetical protein